MIYDEKEKVIKYVEEEDLTNVQKYYLTHNPYKDTYSSTNDTDTLYMVVCEQSNLCYWCDWEGLTQKQKQFLNKREQYINTLNKNKTWIYGKMECGLVDWIEEPINS
jgi:hypothetical protein